MIQASPTDLQQSENFKLANFWEEKTDLYEWYKWMYHSREEVHRQFFDFLEKLKLSGIAIQSVTDIG